MAIRFSGGVVIPANSRFKARTLSADDPNFSDVMLLVGFDTDFNDESSFSRTAGTTGSPTIDTGTKQFGAGSLRKDANQLDGVTFVASSDFALNATDDYTLEGFINVDTGQSGVGSTQNILNIETNSDNFLRFYRTTTGHSFAAQTRNAGVAAFNTMSGTVSEFEGSFVHWAWVNTGSTSTSRIFLNGVLRGTFTSNNSWVGNPSVLIAGNTSFGTTDDLAFNLDEVRITRAIRYPGTDSFTPPTESFPRS